ncbi:MAG: phenylacetate--CoA ligase family protein [Clostridia bacterium]|nr:MAG: phenylacetate--CoA ligase family protein [Clostridia bacterium]
MVINPLYTPKTNDSPYWNEHLETLPREKLDAWHLKRLRALIKHAYENVPMYRKLYDEAGIRPEDIVTFEDYVNRVPTIDKKDVVEFQQLNPPFGEAIIPGTEQYQHLRYSTSGTTGRPLAEICTFPSLDIYNCWTYGWWAWGIRPGDVLYFAFNFGTYTAFWSAYLDALLMGCQVVTGGGADSQMRVRQILDYKPTVLLATPTYALRLAEVARQMGVDPRETTIRIVAVGGEPGPVIPSIRKAVEDAWGATATDSYGISDMSYNTSLHCPVRQTGFHFNESVAVPLVVDEQGQPVPDGEAGEMIMTAFTGVLTPMIKYRTHDVVRWRKGKCECGRTWVYLDGGVLGRSDHMVTIRGTNVYPAGIQTILFGVEGLSENLEIHFYDGGVGKGDQVMVKVEAAPQVEAVNYEVLKQKAETELRIKAGVRIDVEIVPPGTLPRYELKAKRVFDHRAGATRKEG